MFAVNPRGNFYFPDQIFWTAFHNWPGPISCKKTGLISNSVDVRFGRRAPAGAAVQMRFPFLARPNFSCKKTGLISWVSAYACHLPFTSIHMDIHCSFSFANRGGRFLLLPSNFISVCTRRLAHPFFMRSKYVSSSWAFIALARSCTSAK